ncbi:hypothetical protein [Halopelagius fulvigenes]|uniref:Uncharacterized protein n=1 Tax=Halopelagius fulvigenes TaxID=1198324 RepID=A0ABD5U0G5_9EURY
MERSSRAFIRIAIATGAVAGASGTALTGCKTHDCNKFGNREEQPGNENGQAVGHDKDEGDPGGDAHDQDEENPEKPGQRVGHCKYD